MAEDVKQAGVVVYEETDEGLAGLWTHFKLNGAVGTEMIRGAKLGDLAGTWPVTILLPGGGKVFSGRVTIAPLGPSFRLDWVGEPGEDGKIDRFEGIGMVRPEGLFAASFQEV